MLAPSDSQTQLGLDFSQDLARAANSLCLCGNFCWFDPFALLGLISTGVLFGVPMKLGFMSACSIDFVAGVDYRIGVFSGSLKDF